MNELIPVLKHFVRWHDQISKADLEMANAAIAKAQIQEAAPDLLEACEYVLDDCDSLGSPIYRQGYEMLKAAIAKARGQ